MPPPSDPAMAEAVFKFVRRYLVSAGEAFEISVTVHPAELFAVSMRLQRSIA
jgi:hypothetical protein